jgi:hypothetical protein
MLLAADDSKDSFDVSSDIMTYLKGILKKEEEISANNTNATNDELL